MKGQSKAFKATVIVLAVVLVVMAGLLLMKNSGLGTGGALAGDLSSEAGDGEQGVTYADSVTGAGTDGQTIDLSDSAAS